MQQTLDLRAAFQSLDERAGMPLGTAYPYGMREIMLTPITNSVTEALGTSVELDAARTMSFSEAEEFNTLRGNDQNLRTRGSGPSVSWELEAGGYKADAVKVIYGHKLTDAGTTPNQTRTLRRIATQSRPYFKAEGKALSDSGGDVHVILYRCRATGDFEGEFSDGEWYLTNASGEAFPSALTLDGDTNVLYDIIYNETETDTDVNP